MAACSQCRRMKGGRRRNCRHSRPRPCTCGGLCFPHRRGSRATGWGACEAHPNHYELIMAEMMRPIRVSR